MNTLHHILIDSLKKTASEYPDKLDDVLDSFMTQDFLSELMQTADNVKKTILETLENELSDERKSNQIFQERNYNRWKKGFDLLEKFIMICIDSGATYQSNFIPQPQGTDKLHIHAAIRLHARCCHIANEILCLLKSGYADAAHSRWRALHEVNVTQMFISKYGHECAKRYSDYEVVEACKGMRQHKEYEHLLQAKAPSIDEIRVYEEHCTKLVEKYGKSFKGNYGWAASFLNKEKRISFFDLEKDVGLDHMRPYYKWASQNIHASPKGLFKKLGLCEATEDILLVGPSNSGMTDPAHATAISLAQSTAKLLELEPTADNIVVIKIIADLASEIGDTFLEIDSPDA